MAKEGIVEVAQGAFSFCGTNEYMSPEVLDRGGHGTAVDWWALGMVTYEMLTGLPPWYTTDTEKLFDNIRHAPLKFPMSVARCPALFIHALLNRNPLKRLGANGSDEVKYHPFFSVIDWDALYYRKISPPFDPCRDFDDADTGNFEREFTDLPLLSTEEHPQQAKLSQSASETNIKHAQQPQLNDNDTFLHFTYEEESNLASLRDELLHSRQKTHEYYY